MRYHIWLFWGLTIAVAYGCDDAGFKGGGSAKENTPADRSFNQQNASPSPLPIGSAADCLNPNTPKQTLTTTLRWPTRQDCQWGINGNQAQQNEYIQARFEQPTQLTLPTGTSLCSLKEFRSLSSTLHFDDFMYILMENYLLVGSNTTPVDKLTSEGSLRLWDWSRIVGTPFDSGENRIICAGAGTCVFPTHDETGSVSVSLDQATMQDLATKVYGRQSVTFTAVTTGDNDDGDCFHSGLDVEVTVEYIQL